MNKVFGSGQIEIYKNGRWGKVCSENFDISAADIVCRELGFERLPIVYISFEIL